MFDNSISSVVVTSRVRSARNVAGQSFIQNSDEKFCDELVSRVADSLMSLGKYRVYRMNNISETDSLVMANKHLISKELLKNRSTGAAIVREDEAVSIMVNEEDHIREQCILKGLNLEKAYSLISEVDDELASNIKFAFDDRFGYLTSCVTNVGTGMRASVMLFLPALTLKSEIDSIISAVKQRGLTVRGVLGEGSFPLGYMYQVSNATTIGKSEREIISTVSSAVNKIVEMELVARKKLLDEDLANITDIVWRAWGVLTNCYTIDWVEFMKLAGEVKLGISLGLIVLSENGVMDRIIDYCSDSAIIKFAKRNLTEEEIGQRRAEYLFKTMKKIRIR